MIIKDPETGRPTVVKEEDYPPMHLHRAKRGSGTRPYGFRKRVAYESELPDRAEQGFKDAVNINSIVAKHAATGAVTHLPRAQPMYGDFTGAQSLQEAFSKVEDAEEMFFALPARVRELVDNDPVRYLEALADEELTLELAEAGLPMAEGWEPPEKPPAPPEPTAPEPPEPEADPPQTS